MEARSKTLAEKGIKIVLPAQSLDLPDLGLLREVFAYIDGHPREWEQGVYARKRANGVVCGCVAYHTLRLSGNYADDDFMWMKHSVGLVLHSVITSTGTDIESAARRELGLTWDEALQLFDGDNDRERLQVVFERIESRWRRR